MTDAKLHRASRFCRLMGNPLAYGIVRLLGKRRLRPIELAARLGASATSVVNQLNHLKIAGLVRWHSTGVRRKGRKVEYWLADRRIARCMVSLERCLRRLT